MLSSFKKILHKEYTPLNTVEVFRENLLSNYNYLSSLNSSLAIAPVVKSNGYGHGIKLVGKVFDKVGAPFLCADSLFEAYQLQSANIKTKILIMGSILGQNLQVKKLPFSYAVYNKEMLDAIAHYQPHAGIHLFVDTGLHREGVVLEQLPEFIQEIKK